MTEVLSNGIVFHHERSTAVPVAAMSLVLDGGARDDAAALCGRTNLLARLVGKGSHTRTAAQFAEAFESLGISFGASAGQDFVGVHVQSLAEDFPRAMELFSDALLGANFPWDEIETERGRVASEIRAREDRPASMAMRDLRKLLFDPHAYSRPVEGELDTLREITQASLAEAHAEIVAPSRMIASIVGDVDRDAAKELLLRLLPASENKTDPRVHAGPTLPPRGGRVITERKVEQGFIALGHRTCRADDVDVAAITLATTVLGGGMSSRLFGELRDRRGLAYAVGATCSFNMLNGSFVAYIGTKPASLEEAEEGLWGEVRRLRDEPVSDEELTRSKNYIVGNDLRDMETCRARASRAAGDIAMGLGEGRAARFREAILACTSRDVMRVANRCFLDPCVSIVKPETPTS